MRPAACSLSSAACDFSMTGCLNFPPGWMDGSEEGEGRLVGGGGGGGWFGGLGCWREYSTMGVSWISCSLKWKISQNKNTRVQKVLDVYEIISWFENFCVQSSTFLESRTKIQTFFSSNLLNLNFFFFFFKCLYLRNPFCMAQMCAGWLVSRLRSGTFVSVPQMLYSWFRLYIWCAESKSGRRIAPAGLDFERS